jgi:TatD DNase family protein
MLLEEGVQRAVFHCFTGKVKLGRRISEAGFSLSIPPAIARHDSFRQLVKAVPLHSLLTETDSPYMAAEKHAVNDPSQVPVAIRSIADIKCLSKESVTGQIRENAKRLFRI